MKVMAAMRSRVVTPSATRFTVRATKLWVFPVPALASTNRVSPSSCSMVRRAASSLGRNSAFLLGAGGGC